MAQPVIQASFNTGEWAPSLNARVDLTKYHSAAALLENFFVDYRGGASSRAGTKYILQAYKSSSAVRLIPFQASFTVGYILEFGDHYIRFYNNGAPVLEPSFAISAVTKANPGVVTVTGNNFNASGDWVFINGIVGMTQLNGNYYSITKSGASVTLKDLNGNNVDTSGFGTYISGGTMSRVYTIGSPYAASDLAKIKFAQNVTQLILVHPSYVPYVLTIISAANWTLQQIAFGSTVQAPTGGAVATTLSNGNVNYSYIITAVDSNGQESAASAPAALTGKTDLRTVAGTNTISWNAVSGAASYNLYKSEVSYAGAIVDGSQYGFIGNCTALSFADSNIGPDFSQSPPIPQNPFQGAGVASISLTANDVYTAVPTVSIAAAPSGGQTAVAAATLQLQSFNLATQPIGPYAVGNGIPFGDGIVLIVASVTSVGGGLFEVTSFQPLSFAGTSKGSLISGAAPTSLTQPDIVFQQGVIDTLVWEVGSVQVVSPGSGYVAAPAVTFSSGAATATALLQPQSAGNPATVSFFQQRLVLAAPPGAPQTFFMSQPGSPFNFDISNPIQDDDAITGSIVSGQLNEIKSMVSVPTGLMVLTSQANFLVNGGASNNAITPADATANAHSFTGASDLPPIVSNFDVLFGQAKGSFVRDLTYNFYAAIFTGTDISVLSSHLFYGFTLLEWAWAQEPFKVVWAVRNDGVMLTLTFLKEQEFIGWTHSITQGLFQSVATVTEQVAFGSVDAVYTVVERVINGNTVKYIERVAERIFPNGVVDAWCVDAGIQYNGAPQTNFMGAQHLAGATVTGLADGKVIPPFAMPLSGSFTLGTAASKVTIGLGFTCKLQTLQIDLGEPTVQGEMKTIPSVTVRVADTLGLSIGKTFSTLVAMKDLVVGNVGSATNTPVTDLVTCDAMTFLDPSWTVPGQYCIEQAQPFPASILGVIPKITTGGRKG